MKNNTSIVFSGLRIFQQIKFQIKFSKHSKNKKKKRNFFDKKINFFHFFIKIDSKQPKDFEFIKFNL